MNFTMFIRAERGINWDKKFEDEVQPQDSGTAPEDFIAVMEGKKFAYF